MERVPIGLIVVRVLNLIHVKIFISVRTKSVIDHFFIVFGHVNSSIGKVFVGAFTEASRNYLMFSFSTMGSTKFYNYISTEFLQTNIYNAMIILFMIVILN